VYVNDPFLESGKNLTAPMNVFEKAFNGIEEYNLNKRLLIITYSK